VRGVGAAGRSLAQFEYRAVDPQGKVIEGSIEAAEEAAVVARLHDRGLIPLGINTAGAPGHVGRIGLPAAFANFGRRRVRGRDLLILTQELSALVSAGLPLDRSLGTLAELADNPELKRVVGEVLHAVQGGKSLAEALAEQRVFPALYVNMIRAGEIGGFLEQVLQRLAEYLERAQQLRDDVKSALTYPLLLTGAMGVSVMILLMYVLPKFSALFTGMGRTLPLAARVLLGLSEGLRNYWWAIGGVPIVAGIVLYRWVQTPRGRYRWDQWRLRVPLVGPMLRKVEVASLARTLGTLLKSGVPMLQALGIVKEVAGNQVISRALGEVEVGVREGAGVADPLARSGVFPALAVQMISVGEETGRLDEMLLTVSDHFDREVRVQVQQFTRLLEPVLILVMGLGIGFIVISMLSAIFSVNDLPM
jgi:general secretion pathway protein F